LENIQGMQVMSVGYLPGDTSWVSDYHLCKNIYHWLYIECRNSRYGPSYDKQSLWSLVSLLSCFGSLSLLLSGTEVYNNAKYDISHNLISLPVFFVHVFNAFTESLLVVLRYK